MLNSQKYFGNSKPNEILFDFLLRDFSAKSMSVLHTPTFQQDKRKTRQITHFEERNLGQGYINLFSPIVLPTFKIALKFFRKMIF